MVAIVERYAARVAAGAIESDPGQLHAIGRRTVDRVAKEVAMPVHLVDPQWIHQCDCVSNGALLAGRQRR